MENLVRSVLSIHSFLSVRGDAALEGSRLAPAWTSASFSMGEIPTAEVG